MSNGYVCFYQGKAIDVYADSAYSAVQKARAEFKPPKSEQHMVHCVLAEKDGKPVIHSPDF